MLSRSTRLGGLTAASALAFTTALAAPALAALIDGTPGNDRLRGTAAADVIDGRAGNDQLQGLGGDDVLLGGPGRDVLEGGPGDDELRGGRGVDVYLGGPGDELVVDRWGRYTTFVGGDGDDRFVGGPGTDTVEPDRGADRVHTGAGGDFIGLVRDGEVDRINCGQGRDQVEYPFGLDRRDILFNCERVEVRGVPITQD